MKYFVDAETREASGHENYIEFQLPDATEEFWDKTSLYMLDETTDETGFGEFWSNCMYDGIVFDMCSFSKDELDLMVAEAAKCGGVVFEVISELSNWVENNLANAVGLNWASDRAFARRRAQREAYPVDPKFYEEVKAMYEQYQYKNVPLFEQAGVTERAYEDLLRKYNMPSCFFPFPLYEPDKWE